jgi:hypothetical protein
MVIVGSALACGNLVEGAPLGLHPNVRVPGQHGPRDVPSDAHNSATRQRLL